MLPLRTLPLALLLAVPLLAQQTTPDQQADMILNSARKAYNERNYPFATTRFKEFLQKFGGHKDANSARYGLAICQLEGPERNYQEAIQNLQPLTGVKTHSDHPYAVYYTAHCQRALGVHELAQGIAKPQEAPQRRQEAARRFDEASRTYAAAIAAFDERIKKIEPAPKDLPPESEWAARARCDLAEMQLRTGKTKEARTAVEPFLSDANLVKSKYRRLALYHHGFACVLLKDNLAAGKSLNQLTPFTDPVFGTHANYLLARVHHADGERAEAAQAYQNVLNRHQQVVKEALEALKNPNAFKDEPDERARLQALVAAPSPDHYARSLLYLGVLKYEDGQFAEALARFQEFEKTLPKSSLIPEIQLRIGFCFVQTKQFAEALKTLQPLVDKNPELADQALLWMGKAQSGSADPANLDLYLKAQLIAVDTMRRAAERARADTPEGKARRGAILLEMADTQQLARQFRESAGTLAQILQEKLLPPREEEVMQRQATALHLAGDFKASDDVCTRFMEVHGKSTLVPAVLFRHAENAAFTALAAEKNAQLPDRIATLNKLNDEAIKRYKLLIDKYPEHPQVGLARFGLAMGHYRKNDVEKARDLFKGIPVDARTGELGVVPYALADCLIRLAPTETDDALAAGKLTEVMKEAIDALNAFVGASPTAPQTPDALIKLGFCHMRLSDVQVMPQEKALTFAAARAAYEQLIQKFPQHALQPQAVFERTKVMAAQGDVGGAMNELRRFTNDARLKDAGVAPMALLRLATMLRAQNQAAQAVEVLDKARQAHEPNLNKDASRAGWIALLQYHHGLALKESGKLPEARAILDGVVKNHANRPEAIEAALRFGQCLKEEGMQKIAAARQLLAQGGRKPEQIAEDRRKLDEGMKLVGEAVKYLEARAEAVKEKKAESPTRARMLYDAAWAARTLADAEVESAREKIRQERWQKLKDDVAKKTPQGQTPPAVPAPLVPLSAVPRQESETKVRTLYQTLLKEFADLEQYVDARFELAELLSEREEHAEAIKLLNDALDKEPSAELTDRIKLRLGACQAAKGDLKAALTQFQAIARNEKSPNRAQAIYRAGETLMAAKDYAEAEKFLKQIRDNGAFHNVPGVTDRAMLRLGHTYAQLKQWDLSRQAHEFVVGRFPQGPWAQESRYGMGWAHQNKNELDQAINNYIQVANATATELGARAQLNVGLCKLAQKKYAEASTALLVVPFTYDYPELSAVALLEAARAMAEDKQREKAVQLLKRLLRDHPESEPAKAAKTRLEELEKS